MRGALAPRMYYSFSFSPSSRKAFRAAAMTNAEKVQSFPAMAFSISSMTSLGNRMVLLVVAGVLGISNPAMPSPRFCFMQYIS